MEGFGACAWYHECMLRSETMCEAVDVALKGQEC